MTKTGVKRAAAVWALCGLLTWGQAMYADLSQGMNADVAVYDRKVILAMVISLPILIVTRSIRVYNLVAKPPTPIKPLV